MQDFQDTFETRKQSFISAFSNCMTAPLSLFDFFIKIVSCGNVSLRLTKEVSSSKTYLG